MASMESYVHDEVSDSDFSSDSVNSNATSARSFPTSSSWAQPALNVTPLNSAPYTGPPLSGSNYTPSPPIPNQPAVVFLPSESTEEELERVVASTFHAVAVTGSAALGKVGRPIGSIDILESKDTYLFRVALPGVARDEKTFSWHVDPDGKMLIKGLTTTGEKRVHKHNMVFEMLTDNLCPPGEFTLSFQLPGPVDPQHINAVLGNGIFEGVAKKRPP